MTELHFILTANVLLVWLTGYIVMLLGGLGSKLLGDVVFRRGIDMKRALEAGKHAGNGFLLVCLVAAIAAGV